MMQRIEVGTLRVLTEDGVYQFPPPDLNNDLFEQDSSRTLDDGEVAPKAEIRVLNDSFWIRLVLLGDLGFSEAFMWGDVEVDELAALFRIFILNRPKPPPGASAGISGVSSLPSKLFSLGNGFFNSRLFANTLGNSQSNIAAHYDISNDMFSAFLSPDMTYSCGIFPSLDADLAPSPFQSKIAGSDNLERFDRDGRRIHASPSTPPPEEKKGGRVGGIDNGWRNGEGKDELEEAQFAKLRYIIKKADIQKGHRVLEIGSGWGSFAMEAVRLTGCTVDTLTLSTQQASLARARIEKAGMTSSITVHLLDYRSMPKEWEGSFDRVVSIEMIEAVGKEFLEGYFEVVNRALNAKGAAVFQVITIPESRFEAYQRDVDFIRKWVFPGGFLPTFHFMTTQLEKGSKSQLIMDDVVNVGPHYARTLREWRIRFQATFASEITPSLLREHPEMDASDVEVFKRKWIYYYEYCAAGFTERILGVHIFRVTKEGNKSLGCDLFA
ncbi:S-adenosyl-L-methionine-dependent methyltransferase [Mrakia frigida]|uniref:S-adenosyl-L-methionine-dependent methyltransferase n=1 Tax=Mrakia frigida TaxID=29902 RepID=UPI003FCC2697